MATATVEDCVDGVKIPEERTGKKKGRIIFTYTCFRDNGSLRIINRTTFYDKEGIDLSTLSIEELNKFYDIEERYNEISSEEYYKEDSKREPKLKKFDERRYKDLKRSNNNHF